jgi:hypothetical protein
MLEWFLTINREEIGTWFVSRHEEEVAAVNTDWKIKRPNAALRAAIMIILALAHYLRQCQSLLNWDHLGPW